MSWQTVWAETPLGQEWESWEPVPPGNQLRTLFRDVWIENEYRITAEMVRSGPVLDLGSFSGEWAAYVISLGCPRVIAVEADPSRCAAMRRNFTRHGLAVIPTVASLGSREVATYHSVPLVTLAGLLDEFCPREDVALAKFDIEGGEKQAIHEAPRDVLVRLRRIVMEFHPEQGVPCELEQLVGRLAQTHSVRVHGGHVWAVRLGEPESAGCGWSPRWATVGEWSKL